MEDEKTIILCQRNTVNCIFHSPIGNEIMLELSFVPEPGMKVKTYSYSNTYMIITSIIQDGRGVYHLRTDGVVHTDNGDEVKQFSGILPHTHE